MAIREIIKHDPNLQFIVFKHPKENFNKNSKLVLQKGQWAIVYNNGVPQLFTEPNENKYIIKSDNSFTTKWLKKAINGGVEENLLKVFFINYGKLFTGLKWNIPEITLYDSVLNNQFEFSVSGFFSFKIEPEIEEIEKLLSIVDESESHPFLSVNDVQDLFCSIMEGKMKSILTHTMIKHDIPYASINAYLPKLSLAAIQDVINEFREFGLIITKFEYTSISLTENSKKDYEKHLDLVFGANRQRALGFDYYSERVLDALNAQAANPASAPLANAGAGLGMGLAGGSIFSSVEKSIFNDQSNIPGKELRDDDYGKLKKTVSLKAECENCHAELNDEWIACPYCGNSVGGRNNG